LTSTINLRGREREDAILSRRHGHPTVNESEDGDEDDADGIEEVLEDYEEFREWAMMGGTKQIVREGRFQDS
jgi:hypothetical protein